MSPHGRWRGWLVLVGALIVVTGCAADPGGTASAGVGRVQAAGDPAPAGVRAAAAAPLSIKVDGNHLVNGAGATVRLLGVDVPSTEYACEEGWGYSSLPLDAASAEPIAAWQADAVRVPLNEDCWLGINGQPSYGTVAGYRQAIEGWVQALNAAGLYVILDLHWTAPGTAVADGQRPMPDDHSVAFWTSVASVFASNPAVLFDAFNEPYSPAGNGNSDLSVTWSCWEHGGCPVPVANQDATIDDDDTYTAVGMQALVTAIRSTGASQPILLGGLSYANDLSGWLANEPTDPDHQLVASLHTYYGTSCDDVTCWDQEVAPVAATVPVVAGEFDQGYDCTSASGVPPADATFDTTFMSWADSHGVSYLAWGWWVLPAGSAACGGGGSDDYQLIANAAGSALGPDGTAVQSHLAALAAAAPTAPPTTAPSGTVTATTAPPATAAAPPRPPGSSGSARCHLLARRRGEPLLSWLARSGCSVHSAP